MLGGNPGQSYQGTSKSAGAAYQRYEREEEGNDPVEEEPQPNQHRLRATVSQEMEGETDEYTTILYPPTNSESSSWNQGKGRA